jgi:outer membrane protein OmpA-like peptidoglycan-associated protein
VEANAQGISETQVQQVLGAPSGLLDLMNAKIGISTQVGPAILAFLLPRVIGSLTPHGGLPVSILKEIKSFIGDAKGWLTAGAESSASRSIDAAPVSSQSSGSGPMKWLLLVVLVGAAVFLLGYCGRKQASEATSAIRATAKNDADVAATGVGVASDAPEPATRGTGATKDATEAAPKGGGTLLALTNELPSLKVYFDPGKDRVSPDFAERAGPLADYLKTHSEIKAVISGFNDSTGDAAINVELSKKRARSVANALKAIGVPESDLLLEKPSDPMVAVDTDAELRRVDVTLRK